MFDFKTYIQNTFSVSESDWNIIADYLEEASIRKNEFFIKSGKICRKSGFILDGVMRYFAEDSAGETPTCYFTFEGHYITDPFSYKEQNPSTINLMSVTDCRLMLITYENEQKLLKEYPGWKEITTAMLLQVSMEFANQKTMTNLSATDRYKYFTDNYPELVLQVPLQFIASYLGIAQPSLSRLRKNLTGSR